MTSALVFLFRSMRGKLLALPCFDKYTYGARPYGAAVEVQKPEHRIAEHLLLPLAALGSALSSL